jgi:pimeloyl-ACP methyl ester carboxylesterase
VLNAQPERWFHAAAETGNIFFVHWRIKVADVPLFIEAKEVFLQPDRPTGNRHVIFLHGWNAGGGSLLAWHHALRLLADESWTFWRVDYPTHRWSFRRGAEEIARSLRATGREFDEVILFGYSMGGVTARQLVADDFPCRSLVALGTPHTGVARWVPAHSPGTLSIHRRSHALRELNENPRDIAARANYHFYSLTYRDRFGAHPHDGLIPRRSALGLSLDGIATRENTEFAYSFPPGTSPHLRGMNPSDVPLVMEKMRVVLK